MPADTTSDSPSPGIVGSLVADPKHGVLPVLLLLLTVVTGVVDAVSLLTLGHVFVANMTGNIVFISFALVGTPGFSLAASLSALAGFLIGAIAGGRFVRHSRLDRLRLVRDSVLVEIVLVAISLVISIVLGPQLTDGPAAVIAGVLAVALGVRNAVVRKVAVPDLTTTVLTMTLTGLGADHDVSSTVWVKRILAVVGMGCGAAAGALIVRHGHAWAGLTLALVLLVITEAVAISAARRLQP
ncbi:YoaK family protein [Rudaeicoccus suwonensis]|uniref:Uncharacterized membrane protein YoaK (UPF0700 family) n=1 Tax=Rudaeicoccus suwonensis TaxID=657409 RepID=A0A561E374_9MICO|nr:YoaK family protein [Rudaeicoccus suwonensis]TWE10064.1 uncharacterized membrane protein YoaK (UPF0700 family) [Rudaeicoccus suwonensis]